jgi:allantoate deiminase
MPVASFAGHDSVITAPHIPTLMLFVPSVGGRSHCPQEESSLLHLAQATHVLASLLL